MTLTTSTPALGAGSASLCGHDAVADEGFGGSRCCRSHGACQRGLLARDVLRTRATALTRSVGSDGDAFLPVGAVVALFILSFCLQKGGHQTRLNKSGRLAFSPLAIFPMFTSDTFRIPRSIPL